MLERFFQKDRAGETKAKWKAPESKLSSEAPKASWRRGSAPPAFRLHPAHGLLADPLVEGGIPQE